MYKYISWEKSQQINREAAEMGYVPFNPGIGWTWLIEILIKALSALLVAVTPALREVLKDFLLEYYEKAKETANPWDDFLAKFLLRILGIEVPETTKEAKGEYIGRKIDLEG